MLLKNILEEVEEQANQRNSEIVVRLGDAKRRAINRLHKESEGCEHSRLWEYIHELLQKRNNLLWKKVRRGSKKSLRKVNRWNIYLRDAVSAISFTVPCTTCMKCGCDRLFFEERVTGRAYVINMLRESIVKLTEGDISCAPPWHWSWT